MWKNYAQGGLSLHILLTPLSKGKSNYFIPHGIQLSLKWDITGVSYLNRSELGFDDSKMN